MSKSAPLSLRTSHFLITLGLYCVSTIFRLDYGYLRSRVRERIQMTEIQKSKLKLEGGMGRLHDNSIIQLSTIQECIQPSAICECIQLSAVNWVQSVSASNWVQSISTSNIQLVAIMDKSDKCREHFPSTTVLLVHFNCFSLIVGWVKFFSSGSL